MRTRIALALTLGLVAVVGRGAEPAAAATTFNVGCGDVPGLVDALENAVGGDTVELAPACTYTLDTTYAPLDGLPTVAVALTLEGNGSTIARSAARGTPLFRILHVGGSGNLTVSDLTVTNGALDNFPGQSGGGILNEGVLTADFVTVTANKAFQGGGVNSYKTLTMTNSEVTDNEGTDHGGGIHIYGTASITDSVVSGNVGWILAGGILSGGPLTLLRTTVSGNDAGAGGGVLGYVGGNAPLTITDSLITGNTASGYGGVFSYGSPISISGTTISNNTAEDDCGAISTSGTLWITASTISGNTAGRTGGGICSSGSLVMGSSTVSGNDSLFAGGLSVSGSSYLYRTSVTGNNADADGGGMLASGTTTLVESTVSGNTGYFGGGIKGYGTITVNRSTISNNVAALGGGAALLFNSQATLTNSTVWGNQASTGGGLMTYGTLKVLSSTVGANTSSPGASGGGVHVVSTGSLQVRNSIVATNTGGHPNVSGTVTSFGRNIVGSTFGSAGWAGTDAVGVANPGLAAGLANNGGPTQTVALLVNSPAVNFVPTANCVTATGGPLTVDQRSTTRPWGGACDAGAYERIFRFVWPPVIGPILPGLAA